MALVLDTGPLLAGLDADDPHHARCRAMIEQATERRVVPAPILPEVDYWCRKRLGPGAFVDLLGEIRRGVYEVEELRRDDYERVAEICTTYADLGVGFVDAAVLTLVERFRERKVASLDYRHFAVMRPRHVSALELVPGPAPPPSEPLQPAPGRQG